MHYSITTNTIWNYTIETYDLHTQSWDYIVNDMDEMGEDGWEVCGLQQTGDLMTALFKQPEGHTPNMEVLQRRRQVNDMMNQQRQKSQSL